MRVVLFDIDGTLLDAQGAGKFAMEKAVTEVLGRGYDLSSTDWSGRTDTDILTALLESRGHDAEDIKRIIPGIFESYARHFESDLRLKGTVYPLYPNVKELLTAVREGPAVGLLTGNIAKVAHLKLEAAGLGGFFQYGAGGYGDDDRDRNRLVRIALLRLGPINAFCTPDTVAIVGDSVRDIACARANNCRCLIVATGKTGMDELIRHSPDLFLPDFSDLDRVLDFLMRDIY